MSSKMDLSEHKLKLALLGVLVFSGLSFASVYFTSGMVEYEVSVEGEPVDASVAEEDPSITLSQEEMTANEYQIAQALMSTTEVVEQEKSMSGERLDYRDGQIGAFDGVSYTHSEIAVFMESKYVQVDGQYYELVVEETEDMGRMDSMNMLGFITMMLAVLSLMQIGIILLERREGRA